MKKSLDVLILFILVIARVRIDTLADGTLYQHQENVRRLVEGWWPAWSLDLLAGQGIDPTSIMLFATAFGLLVLYLVVDAAGTERHARKHVQEPSRRPGRDQELTSRANATSTPRPCASRAFFYVQTASSSALRSRS